jgi:hypothetical protein
MTGYRLISVFGATVAASLVFRCLGQTLIVLDQQ